MSLTDYARDKFIAHHMSKVTACGMPSLEPLKTSIDALVMNQMFVMTMRGNYWQFSFNYVRRLQSAYIEYSEAEKALTDYVKHKDFGLYFEALSKLEQCIAALHICTLLAKRIFDPSNERFDKGGVEDRVIALHNTVKHLDERIVDGELLPENTLAVWLSNDGLESADVRVSFAELHGLLSLCGLLAEKIEQLPAEIRQRHDTS